MTGHLYNLVLQKNASIMRRCSIVLHSSLRLNAMAIRKPPPTFPFLKSQCQTARRNDDFRVNLFGDTTSLHKQRSSVGAGYRRGSPAKSNPKTGKKSVFF